MAIIDQIKAKAKSNVKHVVLPEGDEIRTVTAAGTILEILYQDGDEVPCLMNVCAVGKPGDDCAALRPADAAETSVCWDMAMHNDATPTALILSRQDIKELPATTSAGRDADAEQARRGGYVVVDPADPQVVLVANGSEVSLLCEVAALLAADGIAARVVSMPSIGLFNEQSARYRADVLPADVPHFGLTAGLPSVLMGIKGFNGEVFGLERFGASAPYKVLDDKFGFTAPNIYRKVKENIAL